MNEEMRKLLSDLVTSLEHFWLESQAAQFLLEKYQVPNAFDLVSDYCQLEESKNRAHERFAGAHALIRLAQIDSEALESFLRDLQSKGKPN